MKYVFVKMFYTVFKSPCTLVYFIPKFAYITSLLIYSSALSAESMCHLKPCLHMWTSAGPMALAGFAVLALNLIRRKRILLQGCTQNLWIDNKRLQWLHCFVSARLLSSCDGDAQLLWPLLHHNTPETLGETGSAGKKGFVVISTI